jgi:aerobic carbon-monoxide dehydrogenase large subunit
LSETFVGTGVRRKEDGRLLYGNARYVGDVQLPGTLTAVVVRSPHPHARIASIDVTAARALPGVAGVFTAGDLGSALRALPSFGQFPAALLAAWKPTLRPAPVQSMATERVRYVGEPVALVVGGDRYIAEDAADLVEIDYDPLAQVTDVDQSLAPDAPRLFDGWDDNVALDLTIGFGDIESAFARAEIVVRDCFECHRYTGVPLEGRALMAAPDPGGRGMTVWSNHQLPHFLRALICDALEQPEFAVRVVQCDIGGGFGQKAGLYPEDVLIPFAAQALGCPVRWLEDRSEHFMASSHSREQRLEAEIAATADGGLLGLRYEALIDAGAYLTFPAVVPVLGFAHTVGPYRIPAIAAVIRSVLTNKTTSAPYRGAGRPETVFMLNRLIDRVAEAVGRDPVDVRRLNLITPGELPYAPGVLYRDAAPLVLDSGDYPAALERCIAAIDYEGFRREQRAARAAGRQTGIGISCNVEATGIGPFEGARVRVDPSGRLAVYSGVVNTGQGHETVLAQVCADVFSVDPEQITVLQGDTTDIGFSRGTYHSRVAVAGANAVHKAARRTLDKAMSLAAHRLEAAPEDMEIREGRISVKGSPAPSLTLGELAALCIPGGDLPDGMEPGLDETDYVNLSAVTWAYAAHAAIVSVDAETGGVEIVRYVVVHDCGQMLNPMIVKGQIQGGVVAGIGGALLEELVYDEDGQLVTTSFMDYLLPTLTDVPEIEIHHMSTPSPLNTLGVKGAGEGGTVGPPAALAAAVEDALTDRGVRINTTSISPRHILSAIRAAESHRDSPDSDHQAG